MTDSNTNQTDAMVPLCATDAVEEETPIRVELPGFPPLAVFNVGGEFFVTDDTCTHGEASLADGIMEGDTIECPFHTGKFCVRTGQALTFPAVIPIRVYPVTVVNDQVCIAKTAQPPCPHQAG